MVISTHVLTFRSTSSFLEGTIHHMDLCTSAFSVRADVILDSVQICLPSLGLRLP